MRESLYSRIFLRRPLAPLAVSALALAAALALLPGFRMDAHGDSLTLENDPGRQTYDRTRELFGGDDYVIVAVAPASPWSRAAIGSVDEIAGSLERLDRVDLPQGASAPGIARVVSPTRQRLFRSLPASAGPLGALQNVTLMSDGVDLRLARDELTSSELARGNLVSADGSAFALLAFLADDDPVEEVAEPARPRTVVERLAALGRPDPLSERRRTRIRAIAGEIRRIVDAARAGGVEVHASGLPTIVVDMVDALGRDMVSFGVLAGAFMVAVLSVSLRAVRWVVLPALTVVLVVAAVLAGLVAAGRSSTVVTANLSALLVIVAIAHAIHIAIRHREVQAAQPGLGARASVARAVAFIARPCLFAALTTSVGFGSIAVSDIRPNIDFGVAMALGALLAWAASFAVIPPALVLLGPERARSVLPARDARILGSLAVRCRRHTRPIVAVSILAALAAASGVVRLDVETRFTDYFKPTSPIATGLDFIDKRLGGTTPLEVVLYGGRNGAFLERRGFSAIEAVHDWLSARPETGAVLSLASVHREGSKILGEVAPALARSDPAPRELLMLATGVLGRDAVRELVADHVTEDFATARISARIRESHPQLDRRRLLAELNEFVASEPALAGTSPEVTGLFVLYTNMLESLVGSQIRSALAVSVALLLMMTFLFRSARVAAVAFVANVLPVALVLGLMGWIGVPLDMMTVMVASVTLGMAIDSTIHYTVRYRSELARGAGIDEALTRAHSGTGRAVLYTGLTVIGGLWVLVFSQFRPTAWFGVMTSAAMLASLASSLVLLPVLLAAFVRPPAPDRPARGRVA